MRPCYNTPLPHCTAHINTPQHTSDTLFCTPLPHCTALPHYNTPATLLNILPHYNTPATQLCITTTHLPHCIALPHYNTPATLHSSVSLQHTCHIAQLCITTTHLPHCTALYHYNTPATLHSSVSLQHTCHIAQLCITTTHLPHCTALYHYNTPATLHSSVSLQHTCHIAQLCITTTHLPHCSIFCLTTTHLPHCSIFCLTTTHLCHIAQPISILLCLAATQSKLHHTVFAIEEAAVLPESTHLLDAVIPHVGHIIDKDIRVFITAVPHLQKRTTACNQPRAHVSIPLDCLATWTFENVPELILRSRYFTSDNPTPSAEEVRHASRNADSVCPFCIDSRISNIKKGTLSQQIVTHVAPPLHQVYTHCSICQLNSYASCPSKLAMKYTRDEIHPR